MKNLHEKLNNEWVFAAAVLGCWLAGKAYIFGAYSTVSAIN